MADAMETGAVATEWTPVYTGFGTELHLVEQELALREVVFVRLEGGSAGPYGFGPLGSQELSEYTLVVPADQYAAQREDIEAVLASVQLDSAGDPAAQAEAEQDFDVRACLACRYFLHDFFSSCPECGAELVPGVELLRPEQTEPARVVVAAGTGVAMEALDRRLREAGIGSDVEETRTGAVVLTSVPWGELLERTAELEALVRYQSAASGVE